MTEHGVHELLAGDPTTVLRLFAIRLPNGSCPTEEWIDGLSNAQSAAILARASMFAVRGWLKAPRAFNNLATADPGGPRVDEIKHVGENLRLYIVNYSPGDRTAYATHGTYKPHKNRVGQEVSKARSIYQEGMQA